MKETTLKSVEVVVEVPIEKYGMERNEKTLQIYAKEIQAQIQRHVDSEEKPTIRYNRRDECEFCHRAWEVEYPSNEPVCCNKAQEEWAKDQADKIKAEEDNEFLLRLVEVLLEEREAFQHALSVGWGKPEVEYAQALYEKVDLILQECE